MKIKAVDLLHREIMKPLRPISVRFGQLLRTNKYIKQTERMDSKRKTRLIEKKERWEEKGAGFFFFFFYQHLRQIPVRLN